MNMTETNYNNAKTTGTAVDLSEIRPGHILLCAPVRRIRLNPKLAYPIETTMEYRKKEVIQARKPLRFSSIFQKSSCVIQETCEQWCDGHVLDVPGALTLVDANGKVIKKFDKEGCAIYSEAQKEVVFLDKECYERDSCWRISTVPTFLENKATFERLIPDTGKRDLILTYMEKMYETEDRVVRQLYCSLTNDPAFDKLCLRLKKTEIVQPSIKKTFSQYAQMAINILAHYNRLSYSEQEKYKKLTGPDMESFQEEHNWYGPISPEQPHSVMYAGERDDAQERRKFVQANGQPNRKA